MNMALTAGCLFILQCIFLMDISVADPLIDISPSEINLSITSTLDINCTFSINNHPDMAALISLVLSRANSTGQDFEDLAAITEFSPDSVTLSTQEQVSATGVHSQTGESYLSLTWQHPTALQGGVYKCSAHGEDMLGQNVEMTNISSVTVNEADLNYILGKLHQLEVNDASMAQQILTLENDKLSMAQNIQALENDKMSMEQRFQHLENYTETLENYTLTLENDQMSMKQLIQNLENMTQTLENDKVSLEKQIADLESNNSRLKDIVGLLASAHVDYIGSNNNKDYYVSVNAFRSVNQSMQRCRTLGGQFAVIDDEDEMSAVRGFLGATSGISDVVIAGNDEDLEGNWVLPGTNTSLPFTDWTPGRPHHDWTWNCLMLLSDSWSMADYTCNIDPIRDDIRYMCEVPTV